MQAAYLELMTSSRLPLRLVSFPRLLWPTKSFSGLVRVAHLLFPLLQLLRLVTLCRPIRRSNFLLARISARFENRLLLL